MGTRTGFAVLAGVLAAIAVQLMGHDWSLTLTVLVAGVVGLVVWLLLRAERRLASLVNEQGAAVVQSLRTGHAEARRAADAHGKQHATIDHRVVTLHAQAAARDASRGEMLKAAATEVAQVRSELQQVRSDLGRMAARQTQQPAPRPARPTFATTAAVPGQEVLLELRPTCPDRSVNLVLATFTPAQLFAGVRTAVLAGVHAARESHRPLRLIVLTGSDEDPATMRQELADWVLRETADEKLAATVSITTRGHADRPGYHPEDVWIATYWTTAVTLQRAHAAGMVARERVLYLVQDWEPGFMAWGTEYALARDTYRAGFRLVVNSSPLADYVVQQTGSAIVPEQIFAPQVEVARIHAAARRWAPGESDRPRLLCYLRPSKPRNLAALALDALRLWADELPEGIRPIVTLAGEDVPAVDLGPRLEVVMAGKTTLSEYYDLVAHTDLALALMFSPHPSHLPLELPMAGIPTVTNDLDGIRRAWVPGLRVAGASARALAQALHEARADAATLTGHDPHLLPTELGGDLAAAVRNALATSR